MSSTAILEEITAMAPEAQSELFVRATEKMSDETVNDIWAILETRRRRNEIPGGGKTLSHDEVFGKARASLNDD